MGDGVPEVDLNRCAEWNIDVGGSYRESIIKYYLDEAKAQPSFANVNIAGSYHKGSRTVDITVSGKRNEDFVPIEGWTNLTVLLVEDGVIGFQPGADDIWNYSHNGVIRTNVSAVWGDLVEWNGNKYEMHYTATLDEKWNHENMRIVAFLGKPFTGDNYEEIGIVNCEEMHLKDMPVGIHVIDIEETASDVYDLNGRKVRSNAKSLEGLPKGVYIVGGKKIVK